MEPLLKPGTIGDVIGDRILDDASVCSVLLRELFVSPGVGGSSADGEGETVISRIGGGLRFVAASFIIGAAVEGNLKGAVELILGFTCGDAEEDLLN